MKSFSLANQIHMNKNILLALTRLLAVLLFLASFVACQDEDDNEPAEEYFIEATINNAVVKFDDQSSLGAVIMQYEGQYDLGIYGNIGDFTGILIQVYDGDPLSTGNYSGLVQNGDHLEGVRFSYVDELDNYMTDITNPVGSVEITQLNDTLVRGNFSGVLKHLTSGETLSITNGKFFVRIPD